MEIAEKFNTLANLLEIEGANPFRVRAYRNAARIIGGLTKNVADLIAEGEDLTELPGIGKDLAEKIKTLIETGELAILTETETRIPSFLSDMMKIEGLGPKRVQLLYKKLHIKNAADLKIAIEKGKVRKLHGLGEKIEQTILRGIESQHATRIKLADAFPVANAFIQYLKQNKHVNKIECAGSFRRRKETVGDLDILVTTNAAKEVIDYFIHFAEVANVMSAGTTRAAVHLHSGIQVDLRVVPEKSYGAALLYFTGSKEHNIALRKMAVQKNLKLNEYGVFKNEKYIAGKTEDDIYKLFDMQYIEPELREDHGEIFAAMQNDLPKLITLKDICGDLHCHTRATDGEASLEAMAKAAEAHGYEYLAITDHSKHLSVAHGLDRKDLFAQIKMIDKLNAKLKKLVILKSIEVDILENGSLDLPHDVLSELDLTICSIHSHFNLPAEQQTERILRAMDNPHFNIFAHPTGRLINERAPYGLDMERIMEAAKETKCILELNAQPARLDLNDMQCKMAKELGIKIAISTDAHSTIELGFMEFGIFQARRGWLTKSDVINTLPLRELRKLWKR